MVFAVKGTPEIKELFCDWQETMIWSCLQGVMGHLYADAADNPKSAMALIGDFCFLAGIPNRELVSFRPAWYTKHFLIMTAYTPDWHPVIEAVYGKHAKRSTRYAIKKETGIFDRGKLESYAERLPEGVSLHRIDRKLFACCQDQSWSRDFVSLYADYDEYQKMGLGIVAVKSGEIVSGASSYSSYQNGIEIEIDTKESHRRMGLATACAARLILECIDRGLYPSWDAQNPWSVSLAEKLGYHLDHAYTAYEIVGDRISG